MVIAVTGGSGFIGQSLVNLLQATTLDNIRLVTRHKKTSSVHKQYFVANLLDQGSSLENFLDDVDVIYNCAGEVKNTSVMHALHVEGTARLLEAVSKQISATRKHIHWVQLSSVGAYGPPRVLASEQRVVTEDTSCTPIGEYEVTKTSADALVMRFAETEPLFSYTILRPSNVISASMPNQSLRSLISTIKKRQFFYVGSRTAVATYIHVNDVAAALVLCGNDSRARGQIFNLSNDCALSEIIYAVSSASGHKPPSLCIPETPLRFLVKSISWLRRIPLTQERIDALVRHTYYPAAKIKETLGFVPQYAIPSEVASMFEEKLNGN